MVCDPVTLVVLCVLSVMFGGVVGVLGFIKGFKETLNLREVNTDDAAAKKD